MATLTEWHLPLNPPHQTQAGFLLYLTPVQQGRLYYSKYIVDYIGELSVHARRGNVREWKIPASLSANPEGEANGIVYSPDGKRVWFALEKGCRLVEFDPATGVFTAYGGGSRFPNPFRRQARPYPIPFPRHIMFDQTGALWYTAAGATRGLIGRLSPTRDRATFWELPIEQVEPEGIWVEETGREVWFTPVNQSPGQTGAFLARLNPLSGLLTWWSPSLRARPENAGVAAEPSVNPENVWFSHDQSNAGSRVFRMHLPTGDVHEYPRTSGSPRKIAIDQGGNAWVSDWDARVSRIAKNASCGRVALKTQSVTIRSKTQAVRAVSQEARPEVSTIVPASYPVTPQVDGCNLHFPDARLLAKPNGIAVVQGARGPEIYYCDPTENRICLLTP